MRLSGCRVALLAWDGTRSEPSKKKMGIGLYARCALRAHWVIFLAFFPVFARAANSLNHRRCAFCGALCGRGPSVRAT